VTRTGTSDGSAPNIGKIDREPDLAADAWACNVFASEQADSKTHAVAERVLSADQDLELASARIPVIAKPAVTFTTQRQPGREVVQDRKAAGVHMAARGCNPQHARAGITGEQVAYVASNPGLAGNGLLRDEVEPVDWHARPNLRINYGLRYQPVTGPTEVNDLTKIPYGCDCHNFAPHFGFAYRLPDEWGLLRGAYGLQYGEIFPTTFQQLRFDPPLFYKMEFQAPSLVDPLGGLTAADLGPQTRTTLFVLSPNLSTPYSHQYNFSWEPRPSFRWKLQLGYVGSRSHKILMLWTENRALPVAGIPQITKTIEERRPDPRYYEVRRVLNGAHAYFDAARVSLVTPNWRGLMIEAAYWFSKAIDTGANYTNAAINDDAKQGRAQSQFYVLQDLKGLSSFDQTQAFLTRFTWTTPAWRRSRHWPVGAIGRWEFGAIMLVKSGTPFDVLSGSDGPGYGNVDGAIGDRPNLLDPSILSRSIGNPDTATQMLPRSAFAFMRPSDSRGNLGHNVFRKDGIRNVNVSLARSWKVSGEKSLTLRVESVNLLNTPQFAAPGNELASSNFGQITNTLNDGRAFRFSLRFRF
jgi:hypothetical protein